MSKPEHTPGPWTYIEMRDAWPQPEGVPVDINGGVYAGNATYFPTPPEEAAANGHLIAAAPDMRTALEAALLHVSDRGTKRAITRAIAKARGEH